MKKILALILALCMLLALAACGETQTTGKTDPEPAATEQPAPEPAATEEPAPPAPLADEAHDAWVAHGQYLLADGTENSWNGKDSEVYEASALTAITLDDVKAIDEDLYNALSAKDVKYLYAIDLIFGTNDAGWTTDCLIDGVLYHANGSYAFKIAQCTVDVDGDNKVYAEDQWISDPKTAHAESLTPATMFMPVWQEEADDFGFSWSSNPVVIGGAGLYTLVIAQYKAVSSAEQAGFGIGLVLKEAKDGIEYEEVLEFIPADHSYGIVGSFNGWGGDPDVEMAADGENVWVGEVELAAGDEFKVRADSDWTYNWGDADGNNFVCEADGVYTVTITFTDGSGAVSVAVAEPATIIGTWTGIADMRDTLVNEVPDIAPYLESAPVKVTMEFKENGTYTYSFDPTEAIAAMKAAMRSYFEAYINQLGMTVAEFEKAYGDTLDNLIDESLSEDDLADAFASGGGDYEFDGTTVILDPGTTGEVVGSYDRAAGTILLTVSEFGEIQLKR